MTDMQSVLFVTSAVFDDEYSEQLEPMYRSLLTTYVVGLCEGSGFPSFDSVFFISENNCASLVSAHHMAELFEEDYKKRVRYMLIGRDGWADTEKTLSLLRAKDPFKEQLWIVIGSSGWVTLASSALLPLQDGIRYSKNIEPASFICGYTYGEKDLLYLRNGAS